MAVFWPYSDLLLAKSYSPRLIKLNFKKNACLVKEYYWGHYHGKAIRISHSTLFALTNAHIKWGKREL